MTLAHADSSSTCEFIPWVLGLRVPSSVKAQFFVQGPVRWLLFSVHPNFVSCVAQVGVQAKSWGRDSECRASQARARTSRLQ
eukprot:836689-Alexandrium_andersonii.AAC.1